LHADIRYHVCTKAGYLIKELDSLSKKTDSAGNQTNNKPAAKLNFDTLFYFVGQRPEASFYL
jgi:hypothetical protein